ncbi:hypothetical protein, partial [Phormidium sp. CCY1219]|uniref:hypothetical protein n=1 Tax=Phormidium sp. CCY1219 TaxID=2886104 RepID=UPI002D1E5FF8
DPQSPAGVETGSHPGAIRNPRRGLKPPPNSASRLKPTEMLLLYGSELVFNRMQPNARDAALILISGLGILF